MKLATQKTTIKAWTYFGLEKKRRMLKSPRYHCIIDTVYIIRVAILQMYFHI